MTNLFDLAEKCLYSSSIDEKLQVTEMAWQAFQDGDLELDLTTEHRPRSIEEVKHPSQPQLVPPRMMPKRRFNSPSGKIAFAHAIAHIEFNAIHLAWDILYRFRDMPRAFYENWLQVAHDEKRHFCLLQARLHGLGSAYGALPAHEGLWSMAVKTADDLMARLALVPRYLEARGLDVTPGMLKKLYDIGDLETAEILEVILRDEVSHVQYGTTWFHFVCKQADFKPDDVYFKKLDLFMQGQIKGPLNRPLRQQAGFSEGELDQLQARIQA